ncbi:MAG: TonB-dependent receptor, partial [Ferruginibacter sp.]|nr:TonB-dependent receptor [Ferruginibacter sp.]
MVDKDFTSNYNLNESIFAGYASFNIKLDKKTSSKAGLRYEYTNSGLGSETKKNIVDRHYGNWFPSIFISQLINDK